MESEHRTRPGLGELVPVGPLGAVMFTVVGLVVGIGLIAVLMLTLTNYLLPGMKDGARLAFVAVTSGSLGAAGRLIIELPKPFRQGGHLYYFQIGEGFMNILLGAILGVLVWGAMSSGILYEKLNQAPVPINMAGLVTVSLVAGMFSENIIKKIGGWTS